MSHGNFKFGTTVNCMDGRAVEATILWMKNAYELDYVDSITEPGMDNFIRNMNNDGQKWLKRKLEISIKNHGSRTVTVAGHDDCAGNPVSPDEHKKHITECVSLVNELVKEIDPSLPVDVQGLFVLPGHDEKLWNIEKI